MADEPQTGKTTGGTDKHAGRFTGRGRPLVKDAISKPESGTVILILLIGLGFALLNSHFFTSGNLATLSLDATVVMSLAIGQAFVLLTGNIDLSSGSLAAFGGVLVAIIANAGVPWELAILLACLTTAAAGVVNGVITYYARIPSFLATFGMLGVGETLALLLSHATSVQVNNISFAYLGVSAIGGVPVAVVIVVGIMLVAEIILRRTVFGFDLYAIGGNQRGAELAGIRVGRVTIGAFAFSGLLAGFGGCITTSQLMAGYPSSGTGDTLFDAIAGAVVGGVSLFGGVGSALGAFLGALLIGTIQDGLNVVAISYSWQPLIIGVVIVIGVFYDVTARRTHIGARLRAFATLRGGKRPAGSAGPPLDAGPQPDQVGAPATTGAEP
ncbi:MAG: ABC transporter permease [Actinomycetota bacterium]|nr:ABC transporter permease [Actinomycetota bacterium]